MKVIVEKEVDLSDEEVFRTILEDYYENERLTSDGWCQFSSFEDFIKTKYKIAIDNKKELKKWK